VLWRSMATNARRGGGRARSLCHGAGPSWLYGLPMEGICNKWQMITIAEQYE
jgi:hypothetical protein